ncbi:hypothetical protein JQ620_13415 [Bradyrhizobium sp. AUGA SZCCT0274]|uniref:hypothetical protein n=1 Tax=Bradyrhizobium sp. AUGA SZCCT0274 TaxID=2807670 RepID=UPI001BA9AF21|nr:hypothetical protein [Bradyrhizobium sp. AUGA SZCCT0274]MBR1241126.1 hypothetical protein [Bradyrhizobium sp. AUGA SZCCT0274]
MASVTIAALMVFPAAAQEPRALLDLPQLAPCGATSHPRLPEKWRGTYLMAPFTKAQLVLAEIVADLTLPAMRVKLHGVRRGSLDLFVAGNQTYVLKSEGAAIKQCRALGETGWRPLMTDWLAPQSLCAGSAPIGETPVEWWKTAIAPEPASYCSGTRRRIKRRSASYFRLQVIGFRRSADMRSAIRFDSRRWTRQILPRSLPPANRPSRR